MAVNENSSSLWSICNISAGELAVLFIDGPTFGPAFPNMALCQHCCGVFCCFFLHNDQNIKDLACKRQQQASNSDNTKRQGINNTSFFFHLEKTEANTVIILQKMCLHLSLKMEHGSFLTESLSEKLIH